MMRKVIGASAMLLVFGLAAGAEEARKPKPTKVFILSGQSNMVGAGKVKDLPKELAAERKNALVWARGKWTAYKPAGRVGPEVTFTAEMAKAWPKGTVGSINRQEPTEVILSGALRLRAASVRVPGVR